MATDRSAFLTVPAGAVLLLWPALWNGYPIVFADTGTYLSQAIHLHAGWDRPVFYSLFMLPLHATLTLWPVVIVQALLAAWVLWLVARSLSPNVPGIAFVAGVGVLALCTSLPWLVCELMPDLFTPLLVLALGLLAGMPERLSLRERVALAGLATFMIACQQSSLPLACVLGPVLGRRPSARDMPVAAGDLVAPGSTRRGRMSRRGRWLLIVLPPALAVLGLCVVNLAAYGRFAVSPFGNVFLLARVIYDGPGMLALRRDCPAMHWRVCPFLGEFPPTSDDFLWTPDSPLRRAGGPKLVSADATAIILAALRADPSGEARMAAANTLEQLSRFASGDGLNSWPVEVSPGIDNDFPAREQRAYAAARQQKGALSVPPPLGWLHGVTALLGVAGCAILLPVAFQRRAACAGFLLAVLVALPVSAAITGALSAPHDRYQSRIMWLPPFVAVISLAALLRRSS